MSDHQPSEKDHTAKQLADAFDDLPLVERLMYVHNLLCSRNRGGNPRVDDKLALKVADEVLISVIRVVRSYPELAELTGPG